MFDTLLIANRGEIACRIIRTAKMMGLRTVAVHSDADRDAPHVKMADEAHRLGPAPATDSYLRGDLILAVADRTGAQAIHPGYGFLSENAEFAEACEQADVTFVGPPPSAIRAMGLKDEAKRIMEEAGVPVVPGYRGSNQSPDFLKRKAYEIGYPVLIKAVAGGGGKGMRRVDRALDFDDALGAAKREAQGAFGNDRVLLERFVTNPRHVEFQVFADAQGNVVHLGERDCSLQRRHQKVIEEAPAPGMSAEVRETIGQAACDAARAVGYRSAGTVEFIADASDGLSADAIFFMEMNTRLQVEHPVTEMVTGLDLVEWQLRVAAGEELPLAQEDIAFEGHALEARLYAEDPSSGFLPSTGRLLRCELWDADGSVRIDAGVEEGGEVSGHYDPMIAKIIAHGADREKAISRLDTALSKTLVSGPRTNVAFLRACLADGDFRSGDFDTGLIDRNLDALAVRPEPDERDGGAAAAAMAQIEADDAWELAARVDPQVWLSPWSVDDAFQIGGARAATVEMVLEDASVSFEPDLAALATVETVDDDGAIIVLRDGHQWRYERADPSVPRTAEGEGGTTVVRSPMTGRIISVAVEAGASVERGAPLFSVEAMKMEHAVTAPAAGSIAAVEVGVGDQVAERDACVTLDTGD